MGKARACVCYKASRACDGADGCKWACTALECTIGQGARSVGPTGHSAPDGQRAHPTAPTDNVPTRRRQWAKRVLGSVIMGAARARWRQWTRRVRGGAIGVGLLGGWGVCVCRWDVGNKEGARSLTLASKTGKARARQHQSARHSLVGAHGQGTRWWARCASGAVNGQGVRSMAPMGNTRARWRLGHRARFMAPMGQARARLRQRARRARRRQRARRARRR